MRLPKGKKKKGIPYTQVPAGGRALERIRQDRLARGLGELPKANRLVLNDTAAAEERRDKK